MKVSEYIAEKSARSVEMGDIHKQFDEVAKEKLISGEIGKHLELALLLLKNFCSVQNKYPDISKKFCVNHNFEHKSQQGCSLMCVRI